MNRRIRFGVSNFDEVEFSWEPQASLLILKIIGFASLRILGFDPFEAKVEDIAITIIHVSFFSKATIWLKTKAGFDGWQWVFIQSNEFHFYFTNP
jgi:hypothetical protein